MMLHKIRLLGIVAVALLFFTACHRVPRHVRYIPKDAVMVLGVHTGEMRKELAWSAITGSGLLDEMRKAGGGENAPAALKDIEQSGIDFGSTLYFYTKPDTRFEGGMKMAAVLPLDDESKLKQYISSHFAGLAVHESKGRSEAIINGKYCASWNDEVLIVTNSIARKVAHDEPARMDTLGGVPFPREAYQWNEELPDSSATLTEMAAAFEPVKGSGIDEVKHFTAMEKAGHDITLWVGFDPLIDLYSSMDGAGLGMMGTSIANTMFRHSASASGFDFEKGKIVGVMKYYPSDSMRPVIQEFARENVDGDMLRRLPAPGLNMAAGYHLSPAAIKMLLQKLNLSGMANLALMAQGLTLDDALGGFSGDMVFAANNFRMTQQLQPMDSSIQKEYGMTPYPVVKPAADFVFALKIGDRSKLNKVLALVEKAGLVQQTATNTFTLPGGASTTFVIGEKYIAASSNPSSAEAFLREHAGAMPDAVHREISGHPMGMWADIQSLMAGTAAVAKGSPSDSASAAILRGAFSTFSVKGGELKDGASESHLTLTFVNQGENSLVQLLHIAQQIALLNGKKAQPVSMR